MSSVILTNWTVYYKSDAPAGSSGYKQIRWTGGGAPETNTNTINELYSALADLFSIAAQNDADDTIPIRAVTPTVYEIGAFDAGDLEPWFIDPESVKHLTGGSLETFNWTRVEGATANDGNSGIVKVPYTVGGGSQFVASDIGRAIANGSATGTLLWYDTTNSEAWIRPTNSTSTHNWAGPAGTISVTGGTGSVTQNGAAVTGERLWANIFTIGTIASGTEIYITQNFNKITSFWSSGHIDRLFLVDDGFGTGLIDFGLLTIFAREFGKLYDHFTADVSAGGRNPIPLSTSTDINNATLESTIAALTGITFTYGATQQDIGDGGNNKPYDVLINCGGNFLDDFYEYTKYVTRRTATTPLSSSYGRNGEQYITVGELRISYESQTANFAEDAILIGQTSGATGTIVADHDAGTSGVLIVKDVRGTFAVGEIIEDDQSPTPGSATISTGGLEDTLVVKVAPFGTFAGGKFFGARGVWITNMHANDVNNYQLIDSNGDTRTPPISVPIVVSGLVSGDRVSVFRATGAGEGPHKTYLTSTALDNSAGDITFIVQESIPGDTPAEGTLRLVDKFSDATQNKEYRIRYSSWATSTFTFASQTGLAANGTDSTTLTDSGATFQTWGIKHGDLIRNLTEGVIAYVISVDSQTELTTTEVTDWTGDSYEINTLPITTTADDTAYVPYIDTQATGTSVSVSVTYVTDRPLIARVRRKGIVPFSIANTTLTNTGASISAIRNPDNIAQ